MSKPKKKKKKYAERGYESRCQRQVSKQDLICVTIILQEMVL